MSYLGRPDRRDPGHSAYAALGRTLTVFDIANPAAPRRVGAHTFPDKIWGVTEAGGLVYAAVDKYGLAVLDGSGPDGLALRGSFKTPGQAKSVALVGTTALVADHMSGVDFIDVSNPAKPASLGSFFLDGYARAVAAAGSMRRPSMHRPASICLTSRRRRGWKRSVRSNRRIVRSWSL